MGLSKYWFVPIMRLFVRETKGFENIPKAGPAIITANHSSYIDAPLICALTDWYCKRWPSGILDKEIYNRNWFIRFFAGAIYRAIPTNGSVEKAVEALVRGDAVVLFPEGERTLTGEMQKTTHTGLGVLAERTGAPVIPVGIKGTYEWWPAKKKIPTFRTRCISIKAGKPMKYSGKPTKKDHLAFQKKVMQAIAKLAGQKYKY